MSDRIEELPLGWTRARLADVAALVKDSADPQTVPDAPYVGLEHIEAQTMRLLDHGHGADVKSTKTTFHAGDVLYGKLRPYLNKVARPEFDGICSTDILVLRGSLAVDSGYLANYINQISFADQAHHLSSGMELPRVGWNALSQLEIAFPESKAEQRRIVTLIAGVRKIQADAEDHLGKARRAVEAFRQAVIAAACTGRLTADWRERHPRASFEAPITVRGNAGPLVDTPDSWVWLHLRDVADVRGGVQKGAKLKPGEPTREVPYLRVANVQRGWLDLSEIKTIAAPESKIAQLTLQPGDLLFNEGGDRDKLGRGWVWEGQLGECIHQNHVFRARLRNGEMQPRFYSWYGNTVGASYFVDQGKQTVNLASLSMTRLKELPVPVPPFEEQAEIVRRVDRLLAVNDRLQQRVEAATHRVERSSQAVLAKAFRGELTNGDNYFPTSVVELQATLAGSGVGA